MRSVVLLPTLAAAVLLAACSRPEPAPEPIRAVRTVTIEADSAGTIYEFAAELRARTESRLSFRVGGKLVRRQVDLGDAVKAGQVLAQLDPQDLRLAQDAAQAALNAAQAQLEQSTADFRRFKELRDQGFISSAELERRDTALKAAQAQFEQARAQAGVQGNQARYAVLVADAPGVVTGIDAEPGMVVGAGMPVLRLAHDGPRDAVFSVPEDKVPMVRALLDQPGALKVRVWGNGSESLPATVREVAAAADPATRTFQVKADVGRAPIKLGQTATVLLATPRQQGVIKLPLAAILEREGRSVVWLLDKSTMTVQPQPIQVAGADGNAVVVAGGLQPGHVVVTAGVHLLTPGQKVRQYVEPSVVSSAPSAATTPVAPAGAGSK